MFDRSVNEVIAFVDAIDADFVDPDIAAVVVARVVASIDGVVGEVAIEIGRVKTSIAVQQIVARAARQLIVTATAIDRIGARLVNQDVIATEAIQDVQIGIVNDDRIAL
ncbi:hypothetical protein Pla100_60580 [Neorhodopirellula pilleata]|uniref:Uncharacterized protein n=1 Tax=Neorhodopirellula pilleata TaxID=2714738 RepID=A0A5C5ZIR8_9BACT|nr:hypothetical protein Pla100_60580 [Neorhodopirellula pilleata]